MAVPAIETKKPKYSKQAKAQRASAALVNAARSLLMAEGISAISVRRLAEHAGCTTMAVYSHFGGKDGILAALFDEGFAHLAAAQQAVPQGIEPADRLLRLCRAYREVASSYPHHYDLMLGQHSASHRPSPESQQHALSTFDTLVAAARLHWTCARSAQVRDLAQSLFAFSHGWAMLQRIGAIKSTAAKDLAFDSAVTKLLAN